MRLSSHASRWLLLTSLFVTLAGCNAPGPRSSPPSNPLGYLPARGADLMDLFELNVGAGTGLFVGAAVEPIRFGGGKYDASKLGMDGRCVGTWEEQREEIFMIHAINWWRKQPLAGNAYLFDPEAMRRFNPSRAPDDFTRPRFYEPWGWVLRMNDWEKPWLDVGVEANLIFFNLDVGFSPQETVDFLLGIFTVDVVSRDDYCAVPVEEVIEVQDDAKNYDYRFQSPLFWEQQRLHKGDLGLPSREVGDA